MTYNYIELYYSYLLTCRYSINTINTYITYVKVFSKYLDKNNLKLSKVTIQNIIDFMLTKDMLSRNTKKLILSSLKSVYTFLQGQKIVEENIFDLLDFPSDKRECQIPRVLSIDEIEKFLSVIDMNTYHGIRDYAIFELIYSTGMRVSEIANLKFEQIHLDKKIALVCGKGSKERFVVFGDKAKTALEKYFKIRSVFIKINNPYIFVNIKGQKISRHTIWERCQRYKFEANIETTVHTFRHSFATHMYLGGANLEVLRKLLGHENLDTTCIYTHLDTEYLSSCHKKYFH